MSEDNETSKKVPEESSGPDKVIPEATAEPENPVHEEPANLGQEPPPPELEKDPPEEPSEPEQPTPDIPVAPGKGIQEEPPESDKPGLAGVSESVKSGLVAVPEPESSSTIKDSSPSVEVPHKFGDRAVQSKFLDGVMRGMSQIWGSRVLVLISILILCCIFVGTDVNTYFMHNEIMVEVSQEKLKIAAPKSKSKKDSGPIKVPISVGNGLVTIVGHLILVVLTCRCLLLMFRKDRNDIDYRLTQF